MQGRERTSWGFEAGFEVQTEPTMVKLWLKSETFDLAELTFCNGRDEITSPATLHAVAQSLWNGTPDVECVPLLGLLLLEFWPS